MLLPVTVSPFDTHPELLEIWPHRRAELLRDMRDCLLAPDEERVFLIEYDGTIVGLTGFYKYDDQVGLNWHGIMKAFEGRGYGRAALEELVPLAMRHYPHATHLIEEIPADREDRLKGFFLRAGFVRTDTIVDKPWITFDTEWIEYRRELRRPKIAALLTARRS